MQFCDTFRRVAVAVAMIGATGALAQEKPITQNGVPLVSGGVGVDSEESLKSEEHEFNLKLVFTLVEGNYIADVNVVVRNAAGKALIEDVAEGPFFMAKLPPGSYTITATYSGKSETRKVAVGKGGLRTEYMRWHSDPKDDFVLPPESRRE